MSSLTSSVCPYLSRKFVFIHSHYISRPPEFTGFYCVHYVWFIVKLFQFSTLSPPPLPSLPQRTKYCAKDFPIEYTQSSFIIFCRSPGICVLCKCYQILEIKKINIFSCLKGRIVLYKVGFKILSFEGNLIQLLFCNL